MPKDELDLIEVKGIVDEVKSGFEAWKATDSERLAEAVKGVVDPILLERQEKIDADLNEKQVIIDKLYAASRRKTIFLDGKQVDEEELNANAYVWANITAKRRGEAVPDYSQENLSEYTKAFARYLRKDDRVITADEQKALSVGSDPDGGYTVHPDMSGRIVKRVFDTSAVRAFASTQVISTDALEGVFDIDEATSGWVGETATRAETDTPTMDVWRIPVHEQYAEPRATQKLLDDSAVNIESWLADKVADILSRTENTAFVTGTGVTQPRGFATYPDRAVAGTFELGAIQQHDTGVNGDFAVAPAAGDILLDAIYSMKENYRVNGVWAMGRLTTGAFRKEKDSDGHYIWQPSAQAGEPATIFGYPTVNFEDMAAYTTTGGLAIAFADWAQAYQIVDRMGIRVLRDPYTAKPFVKFYTTKRVGGDVLNFEAIKLINFTA